MCNGVCLSVCLSVPVRVVGSSPAIIVFPVIPVLSVGVVISLPLSIPCSSVTLTIIITPGEEGEQELVREHVTD